MNSLEGLEKHIDTNKPITPVDGDFYYDSDKETVFCYHLEYDKWIDIFDNDIASKVREERNKKLNRIFRNEI